ASGLEYFLPVIVPAWLWLVWRGGRVGRTLAAVAVALVVLSDQGSAGVLKPLFGRPRPHSPAPGFPSSHASNLFAQATLFSYFYPRLTPVLLAIASVTGFSRVYLGKHYPLDVFAGAVFGALCGALAIAVVLRAGEPIEAGWRWIFSRVPERYRPADFRKDVR
ncbi:MAG: phosphatase PAP2 family protein, partial [Myxococcota bacterium]